MSWEVFKKRNRMAAGQRQQECCAGGAYGFWMSNKILNLFKLV